MTNFTDNVPTLTPMSTSTPMNDLDSTSLLLPKGTNMFNYDSPHQLQDPNTLSYGPVVHDFWNVTEPMLQEDHDSWEQNHGQVFPESSKFRNNSEQVFPEVSELSNNDSQMFLEASEVWNTTGPLIPDYSELWNKTGQLLPKAPELWNSTGQLFPDSSAFWNTTGELFPDIAGDFWNVTSMPELSSFNTTTSTFDSSADSYANYERFMDESRHWVQRVMVPLVMCVGVVGNSVSMVVLTRRKMRSSTNSYLTALAISDLLYLVFVFSLSLKHHPDIKHPRHWFYWQYFRYALWLTDASSKYKEGHGNSLQISAFFSQ